MGTDKPNSTSFKKGQVAWNKNGKEIICLVCNNLFYVPKHRVELAKCCSKKCSVEYWKVKDKSKVKREICLKLAKEKKTIREISEITGLRPGSVSSYLNKAKYRIRDKEGNSYTSISKRLKKVYKECMICGFNRIVEIAHIIPASQGGELTEQNTIGLCPNHHHLFDYKKLTIEEAEKLKEKVSFWNERVICANKK